MIIKLLEEPVVMEIINIGSIIAPVYLILEFIKLFMSQFKKEKKVLNIIILILRPFAVVALWSLSSSILWVLQNPHLCKLYNRGEIIGMIVAFTIVFGLELIVIFMIKVNK